MAVKKGGLGRGLDSLFNENATETSTVELKIIDIEPNKNQPRSEFDEEALSALADSISKHGVLQPIVVRPLKNGMYQIVAGERRWRASRIAELDTIPAVVKEMTDSEVMQVALIENLQRQDLNPVEEAKGYKALMDEHLFTQEQVAEAVGKSRSAVANALRLLSLTDVELENLKNGAITAGHARALLAVDDKKLRAAMLEKALNGASVRELENMAKFGALPKNKTKPAAKNKFYSEVELSLKSEIHRKVKVVPTKNGRGTLTIEFHSDSDLADIANALQSLNK
ncbi:MAG: ParB/RepB/Spo0J family partition protein [Clostridia bacterium]|nr:ParB/RepB/Spo0J family partition protein [Clostridia bacterium]